MNASRPGRRVPSPLSLIAIVEDDQSVLESLEGLLESAGYTAIPFYSAEQFLNSGRLADITCLVSDFGLPAMNGIDLLRVVKATRSELPVIIITAHDEPTLLQAALRAGAHNLFRKPLDDTDLLEAIAALQ
jgi:FixJ family two-component response regulator